MTPVSSYSFAIVRLPVGPAASPSSTGQRQERRRSSRVVVQKLRAEGLKATAWKAIRAAGIVRVNVYAMRRGDVLGRAARVSGVRVGLLCETDKSAYLDMYPDATSEQVTERFRVRDSCIAAWRGDRIVGVRWLSTVSADVGPMGVSFPLCPGVAYAYDAFTAPEERGRGIGAMVTAALFEYVTTRGATRVVNAVLPENPLGQGLARSRSDALGMIRSNRIGSRLIVRSNLPPGYLGKPVLMGSLR